MRPGLVLAILLALHGAIHVMGFARAFGLGEVPLQKAMGPAEGLLWLLAAVLLVVAAVAVLRFSGWWRIPALIGVLLSQDLILGAWTDARWGTVANLLVLVALLLAATDPRTGSARTGGGGGPILARVGSVEGFPTRESSAPPQTVRPADETFGRSQGDSHA